VLEHYETARAEQAGQAELRSVVDGLVSGGARGVVRGVVSGVVSGVVRGFGERGW